MIDILVCGVAGRMGSRLANLVMHSDDLRLVGATEHPGHEAIGEEVGDVAGTAPVGAAVADDLGAVVEKGQVVIAFTTPEATLADAATCAAKGVAMVVGTTGFSDEQLAEFRRLVEPIACVFAPNYSTAMNVLFKLVEEAASVLGDDYDVEVIEAHHRLKVDAPSGSALRLAESAASGLDPKSQRRDSTRKGRARWPTYSPGDWHARDPRRRLSRRSHGPLRRGRRVRRTAPPCHQQGCLRTGGVARDALCRRRRARPLRHG